MKTTTIQSTQMPVAEHLFDEDIRLTGITEYGVSWEELGSGQVVPPPEGARFDLSFEGTLEGPRIRGTIRGVDYMTVRADGRFQLDIQACVETDDGVNIALREDGILIPSEEGTGIGRLRLNLKFTTADPRYSWLNKEHVWATGSVQQQEGRVSVKVYKA